MRSRGGFVGVGGGGGREPGGEGGKTHEADGAFVAELGEELEHFGGGVLDAMLLVMGLRRWVWRGCGAYTSGWCQGAVDVEETDGVFDASLL